MIGQFLKTGDESLCADGAAFAVSARVICSPVAGVQYEELLKLDDVADAWNLVYHSYLRRELIDPNRLELHTVPQAVTPYAIVVLGRIHGECTSTLTAMLDSEHDLPLQSVYDDELNQLRKQGRRLAEVGLLADRREHFARTASALFDLMRFGVLAALHCGADDLIIGVHPHHAKFYNRFLGFEQFGDLKAYPTVRNNPVVGMRLDLHRKLSLSPLPRGLKYCQTHPVPAHMFVRWTEYNDPAAIARSDIGAFLDWKASAPLPRLDTGETHAA